MNKMLTFLKKSLNLLLGITNLQKFFLVFFVLHYFSDGRWVYLFSDDMSYITFDHIEQGFYYMCVIGFLVFNKKIQ
jgi:hypothetical protein